MSFVMSLYSFFSSADHFCPDGYTCGNIWKPATLCIYILGGSLIKLQITTGNKRYSRLGRPDNCTFFSSHNLINDGTAGNLFQQFHVKELTVNMQSSECKIHMRRVAGFCTLPQVYPSGQKGLQKITNYKPITKDIVDGVTHELTLQDVENDPN